MAKPSKLAEVKDVPADARAQVAESTGLTPAPALPTLSTEEKRALGDAFLTKFKAKEDAEAAYEAARKDMSASVEAIVKAMGHKGPFTIGGRKFSAKLHSTGLYSMTREKEATEL